jgi:hypothetical protein
MVLQCWHALIPSMCFYPRGCIKFNPDDCCHLDLKVPLTNDRRERWADRVSYHIHPLLDKIR